MATRGAYRKPLSSFIVILTPVEETIFTEGSDESDRARLDLAASPSL
jgi:hypothetical protein